MLWFQRVPCTVYSVHIRKVYGSGIEVKNLWITRDQNTEDETNEKCTFFLLENSSKIYDGKQIFQFWNWINSRLLQSTEVFSIWENYYYRYYLVLKTASATKIHRDTENCIGTGNNKNRKQNKNEHLFNLPFYVCANLCDGQFFNKLNNMHIAHRDC